MVHICIDALVLELQFKKYDPSMTGALHKKFMSEIVQVLLKEDPDLFNEDQIWEQIEKKSKGKPINREHKQIHFP